MSEVMSARRCRLAVALGMWLAGFTTACAAPSGPDGSIVVLPRIDTVVLGSITSFNAQWMGDAVGAGEPIRWFTADSTVATIHPDGRAHALGLGTTGITASGAGVTSPPATLVVVPQPPSVIALTPARVTVRVGSVVLFTANVVDAVQESPEVSYVWTASDARVAAVFEVPSFPYALVVALRPGIAEIKVAAGSAISSPSVFEVVGVAGSSS